MNKLKYHIMKIIITGASKGIGKQIATQLSEAGHTLGLVARSSEILEEMTNTLPGKVFYKSIDLSQPIQTREGLIALISEMEGLDIMIANAGVGFLNAKDTWLWENEQTTIDVNVSGFVATCDIAFRHFQSHNQSGQIVGIASVAGIRGYRIAPAYHASKGFESIYLDSLRHLANYENLPISITEIRPGFVETELCQTEPQFWVTSPEKAARQIITATQKKKRLVYVSKRWRIIGFLMKLVPSFLYEKF